MRMKTTFAYKGHGIIAAAKRDDRTGEYKPTVHITWHTINGGRECHAFSLSETCETFEKAGALAQTAAKAWADRRLISGQ
jgi:hypothetical protein